MLLCRQRWDVYLDILLCQCVHNVTIVMRAVCDLERYGNPHTARNSLILLKTHWPRMGVGEVAARSADGCVKYEIRLDFTHTRIVYVNNRLRREIGL